MRRRNAHKATLDSTRQHLTVLRQDMVSADVRQDVGEDVAQLDVAEVAFLDAFATNAVGRVT